jgi:hypothetical protein
MRGSDRDDGSGGSPYASFSVCKRAGADFGPTGLTLRPLAPIYLADPMDGDNSSTHGDLTHLEWLEDVELLSEGKVDKGSENAVNLRLLAVMASRKLAAREGRANAEYYFSANAESDDQEVRSSMTTWALSSEPYLFSEAFAALEAKKADVVAGEREWVRRPLLSL